MQHPRSTLTIYRPPNRYVLDDFAHLGGIDLCYSAFDWKESVSGNGGIIGMKILVVDDYEPLWFLILYSLARAAGLEIAFVANGDVAFECYCKNGPYDVVLTDFMHPGLSGLELSKAIRKKNPRQAIALFTADISDSTAHSFHRLNIPVLEKPTSKYHASTSPVTGSRYGNR